MKTYTDQFGTLTVIGKTAMYSHTQRIDSWTNHNGDTFRETCHVTGPDDESPRVTTYDRESPYFRHYDPACSCCYLNFTHSIDKHDSSIHTTTTA